MSPILSFLISWVESRYPGAKVVIDFATQHLDSQNVSAIILQALTDLQKGMSFVDVLKDLLSAAMPEGVKLPE